MIKKLICLSIIIIFILIALKPPAVELGKIDDSPKEGYGPDKGVIIVNSPKKVCQIALDKTGKVLTNDKAKDINQYLIPCLNDKGDTGGFCGVFAPFPTDKVFKDEYGEYYKIRKFDYVPLLANKVLTTKERSQ